MTQESLQTGLGPLGAVAPNTAFVFTDYTVGDDGIHMHFVATNPGPGLLTDYYILLTDADLAGVATQADLRTLVSQKLQRKIRASGIATKLDPFIGQSLAV